MIGGHQLALVLALLTAPPPGESKDDKADAARTAPIAPASAPAGTTSAWRKIDASDPMTDVVRPISYVEDSAGNSLVIKCDVPGKRSVYASVISRRYLGNRNEYTRDRHVTMRFDSGTPFDIRWRHRDMSASLFGDALNRDLFFSSLRASEKLALRLTTYTYDVVDMVFDITGAREEVDRVFAACKDTLPTQ